MQFKEVSEEAKMRMLFCGLVWHHTVKKMILLMVNQANAICTNKTGN